MLRSLLHRVVAHPTLYDLSQRLAGGEHVAQCLATQIETHRSEVQRVADIGGGTGLFRKLWPAEIEYICGELDSEKLHAYHERFASDYALCMDGATAIAPNTCDAVMNVFVLHHVPEKAIQEFVAGCVNALRPGGILVVAEPLWMPTRLAARALWSVDRGSYPRTREELHAILSEHIPIISEYETSVFHKYWLAIGQKPQ